MRSRASAKSPGTFSSSKRKGSSRNVVDVDRHHNLPETLARAQHVGWSFAVSNPCSEVWLQLHYVDAPAGDTAKRAKKAWKSLRNDRGERSFSREDVELACARAAAHPDAAAWIPVPPPSTTVFRLVRDLLGA